MTFGTPAPGESTARMGGMTARGWLNWAAIVTWLVVSLPTLADIANGRLATIPAALWLTAFLVYGGALVACMGPLTKRVPMSVTILAIEAISGLALVDIRPNGSMAATLVIVAAQAPYVMSPFVAGWWLIVQALALTLMYWRLAGWMSGLVAGGALGGFQLFAMATSSLAMNERRARDELTRVNAELTATRGLLAEKSRAAERLRIARDLHDTLGHHLTALSLQLDVISRLASGLAADHAAEAHAITRLLLSDVRDVVGRLRDTGPLDTVAAIRTMVEGSTAPEVHLEAPDTLALDDPARAQALLRCVQEIITNAVRHAGARNLWIQIDSRADGIDLHAHDDGRGVAQLVCGNGLNGMRERFAEYSGRIEFSSTANGGFEVRAFMPRAEAAS